MTENRTYQDGVADGLFAAEREVEKALQGALDKLRGLRMGAQYAAGVVSGAKPVLTSDAITIRIKLDGQYLDQKIAEAQSDLVQRVTDAMTEDSTRLIQEHSHRSGQLAQAANSAGYGSVPPPTSAKFRICDGCGNAHPLTTIGGRLVEHWHPNTLGDPTLKPTVCSQRQIKST